MDKKINIHFASSTSGSIFEITNDLCEPLKNNFNLTKEWEGEVPDEDKRDVLLLHFYDKEIIQSEHFNSFKKKILIQPIDGTSIKEEVVDNLNKFDLIICPAEASKDIMIMNGVIIPIEVIPNYYKSDMFRKSIYTDISKHIPAGKIIFYHESTLHPRKGIELLYEGFVRAFSDTDYADKVVLIIKDQPYNLQTFHKIEKLKRQTIKLQKRYKKPASIIKISAHLSEDELKDLWVSTDIYVSLAKMEGFGIPLLRMFLMGKPIICLHNHYSGYKDYLNDNNAYMIPTVQNIAIDEFMPLYTQKTKWAEPSINDVINMFKVCLGDFLTGNNKSIKRTNMDDAFYKGIYDTSDSFLKKYSFANISNNYVQLINKTFNNNN